MRVLLVQPASNTLASREEGKPAFQPLGLGYLAGALAAHNVEVGILDVLTLGYDHETPIAGDPEYLRYGLPVEDIESYIRGFGPDMVGVSCMMSCRAEHAYEVCALAKRVSPEIVTVLGGQHPTCMPLEALEHADYVVLGEGEDTLVRLAQGADLEELPGVARRTHDGSRTVVAPHRRRPHLDSLAFPRHDLFELDEQLRIWQRTGYHYYEARKWTSMNMGRGCPHHCRHCPHNVMFPGYRLRTPANIVDEMEMVYTQLGVEEVQFPEYNALVSRAHTLAFCDELERRGLSHLRWGFPIGVWVAALDQEILRRMRQAGSDYLDLAIESYDQRHLAEVMQGKAVDIEHVRDVVRWARLEGYYLNAFFMLGLEGQTKADIEATLAFAQTLDLDSVAYFIAQPLPGAPFWAEVRRSERLSPGFHWRHLRYGKANHVVPGLTAAELEEYRHRGRREFLERRRAAEPGCGAYSGPRGDKFLPRKNMEG